MIAAAISTRNPLYAIGFLPQLSALGRFMVIWRNRAARPATKVDFIPRLGSESEFMAPSLPRPESGSLGQNASVGEGRRIEGKPPQQNASMAFFPGGSNAYFVV